MTTQRLSHAIQYSNGVKLRKHVAREVRTRAADE